MGINTPIKRVCYIYPPAYHYRQPFNRELRKVLASKNVEYVVVYSDLGAENRFKNDTVEISWGRKVQMLKLPFGLKYQRALGFAANCDLVIVQQENKLVLNYILQLASCLKLKKVAFFGHGPNFQSRNPNGAGARLKRFLAKRVDWWFGYTEASRKYVEGLGFPAERITVFNNAVDTSDVHDAIRASSITKMEEIRQNLGLTGNNVCVFVGSIYADRRLEFLVCAADVVRDRVPDFELLVVGGGIELPLMRELAASRPWIKVTGPRFGAEKVELMLLGKLFLMPGLVGLAVVDAGAAGLPTVTTAFPYHSPEIAYVEHGVNGVIVSEWEDPAAYADAVAGLLEDLPRLAAMQAAATQMAGRLTIEAMAERFAEGVLRALAA